MMELGRRRPCAPPRHGDVDAPEPRRTGAQRGLAHLGGVRRVGIDLEVPVRLDPARDRDVLADVRVLDEVIGRGDAIGRVAVPFDDALAANT